MPLIALKKPNETDVKDDGKKKKSETLEANEIQNIMQYHLKKDNAVHLESLLHLVVLHSDCNLSNLVSTIKEF